MLDTCLFIHIPSDFFLYVKKRASQGPIFITGDIICASNQENENVAPGYFQSHSLD